MATAAVRKENDVLWEREVEELFREHYAFMYRAAHAVLGRPADAEDVVQNLFLKFVQHELRREVRKDHTGAVFVSLDRLERGRLISRRSVDAREEGADPKIVFNVTAEGERMLGDVRVAAKQLADALEDFA